MSRQEKSLEAMYGAEDLGASSLFAGGFINFGWWEAVPAGSISVETRAESSRALYRRVWEKAGIGGASKVVEVGCGRGLGCALLSRERGPASVVGIDASPEQVARALALNVDALREGRLAFVRGAAETLPLPDVSCDALVSVEAAQHFASFPSFAAEAARVLAPGGRLAIATFFAASPEALDALRPLLPTIEQDIDRVIPVGDAIRALKAAGLSDASSESLGARVWEGWDRWIAQTEHADGWGRNWLKAWRAGLLDYHLLTAHRPPHPRPLPQGGEGR